MLRRDIVPRAYIDWSTVTAPMPTNVRNRTHAAMPHALGAPSKKLCVASSSADSTRSIAACVPVVSTEMRPATDGDSTALFSSCSENQHWPAASTQLEQTGEPKAPVQRAELHRRAVGEQLDAAHWTLYKRAQRQARWRAAGPLLGLDRVEQQRAPNRRIVARCRRAARRDQTRRSAANDRAVPRASPSDSLACDDSASARCWLRTHAARRSCNKHSSHSTARQISQQTH
jgi:hypothetical protein